MLRDHALLAVLAAVLAVLGAAGALWLSRRPSLAVAIALLSPLVSAALKGNSEEAEMADTGIGAYIRVSLLLLAGLAGLVAFLRARSGEAARGRLPGQFLLLGAFLLLALASAAWSVDPAYTLVKAGSFLALACLLAGVVAWSREPGGIERVLNAAFGFSALWALANLAAMALWPARTWWWNAPDRFQGLSDHPNSMGGFCMMAYPLFLWKLMTSRGAVRLVAAAAIPACGLMQLLSGSRSSMIGAGVGILVFLLAARRPRTALAFAGAVALAAAAVLAHPPESLRREVSDDAAVNLTGRPDIWNASWRLFLERPLAGYGFETQNKLLGDSEFQRIAGVNWTVLPSQSTHNGYLSVVLGGGAVAFLLWLALLLLPYVRLLDLPPGPPRAVVLSIMTMSLATNMVESLITGGGSLQAVIFWLAWALAARLPEAPAGREALPAVDSDTARSGQGPAGTAWTAGTRLAKRGKEGPPWR